MKFYILILSIFFYNATYCQETNQEEGILQKCIEKIYKVATKKNRKLKKSTILIFDKYVTIDTNKLPTNNDSLLASSIFSKQIIETAIMIPKIEFKNLQTTDIFNKLLGNKGFSIAVYEPLLNYYFFVVKTQRCLGLNLYCSYACYMFKLENEEINFKLRFTKIFQ